MELAFDSKVRDIKPFVLDYARHWIKDQMKVVMEYFTRHHHDIVQQFKDFKARTAKHLAFAEE